MDIGNTTHDHGSEKLDNLIGLVEKLLDKVAAVDEKMKDKCDVETVKRLETRIGTLEDRALQTEQDIGSKLSSLELKMQQQLDDKVSTIQVNRVWSKGGAWITGEGPDGSRQKTWSGQRYWEA